MLLVLKSPAVFDDSNGFHTSDFSRASRGGRGDLSLGGRHVLAVGGHVEVTQLPGIRLARTGVAVFALSGLVTGIVASIGVSLVNSGQPRTGTDLQISAIGAIILGGVSIYGGVGAVWRFVSGVILTALVGNGLNLLSFNPQIENLVGGAIIMAAVGLSAFGKRR
jgi:ribose transport system permease protein